MTTFVKRCPKCGHDNPEYENACGACSYFIGMETPTAVPSPLTPTAPVPSLQPQDNAVDTAAAQGYTRAPAAQLYLQVLGGQQLFEVQSGWVVGQAHATSAANLQLRDLPGVTYVHRSHCRFDYRDGTWQITAIDQRSLGKDFTNPTVVNQMPVAPGQSQAIKNGDQISLGNLRLVVRTM